PVTSIINDISRLNSYETFSTSYNSKDNSNLPKILINQLPQFHLARERRRSPPIAACKVLYSIVNDISNKDADIICGQFLEFELNMEQGKKEKGLDEYYFGEYNNNKGSLMGNR
ncbi:18581_t:CDS:2, partial [Gigaspora rosea]